MVSPPSPMHNLCDMHPQMNENPQINHQSAGHCPTHPSSYGAGLPCPAKKAAQRASEFFSCATCATTNVTTAMTWVNHTHGSRTAYHSNEYSNTVFQPNESGASVEKTKNKLGRQFFEKYRTSHLAFPMVESAISTLVNEPQALQHNSFTIRKSRSAQLSSLVRCVMIVQMCLNLNAASGHVPSPRFLTRPESRQ